jgi:hypothetical protein
MKHGNQHLSACGVSMKIMISEACGDFMCPTASFIAKQQYTKDAWTRHQA